MDDLQARRLDRWRQTPERRIPGPDEAKAFIEQVGVTTHFDASPEFPNLWHAHMGDPAAKMDPKHDSPAGDVYTWRWHLGRMNAGFYGFIVRKRPTWVRWDLLPAMLRLRGELRTPDELFDLGVISSGAYRLAQALEQAGGELSTPELRQRAGFPTGKESRAAYGKALTELDTRMMVAKTFLGTDDDMHHVLVMERYRDHLQAADRITVDDAWDAVLGAYLPNAVYAVPTTFAKHLGVDEAPLRAALERLRNAGTVDHQGMGKSEQYVWKGGQA
jgi:hypothetical protein